MPASRRAEPRAVEVVEDLDAGLLRSWSMPVDADCDKYSRGTVLVIGGSAMTPGAVLLAGRAALRMGAGRLQIATVRDIAIPVGVALPEAMVLPFDTVPDDRVRESIGVADAVVVGPGLVGDDVAAIVDIVLCDAQTESTVVLDAAAIMVFGQLNPVLVERSRSRLVMTPNRQEARSLITVPLGDDADVLREGARVTGAVLTSFGDVHAPDGRTWRTSVEARGLGTSGSGDVLAGLVAGAAARCADRAQAACWATFAHLEAGRRLESRVGPVGYLATDLLGEVPFCLPR